MVNDGAGLLTMRGCVYVYGKKSPKKEPSVILILFQLRQINLAKNKKHEPWILKNCQNISIPSLPVYAYYNY